MQSLALNEQQSVQKRRQVTQSLGGFVAEENLEKAGVDL